MFEKLAEFFRGNTKTLVTDNAGKPTDHDVKIACGVLLLEMSGVDEDYHEDEAHTIVETIKKQFKLGEEEALSLLSAADSMRSGKEKLDEFFSVINQTFSDKQRELVFAMLWKVVIADGRVDNDEAKLATQFRFRLKLSDDQFESAKAIVERGEV